MNTYRIVYRLKEDDIYRSWHLITAKTDEDAAYQALDFTETHKYALIDVIKT